MFKKIKQIFSTKFIPVKEFINTDEHGYVHLSSFLFKSIWRLK